MAKELVIEGLEDLAKYTVERLDLFDDVLAKMGDVLDRLTRIEAQGEKNMALSDQELAAIKSLQGTMDTLSGDVSGALSASATTKADLRQQIGELERTRDAALAKDVVDEATVTSLNASIDALNATAAQHEKDVVAALTEINSSVSTLDTAVKTVDTSAAPVPPVVVAPPDLSGGPVVVVPAPGAAPPDLSGGAVPAVPQVPTPVTPAPPVVEAAPVVEPTPVVTEPSTSPAPSTGSGPAATDPGLSTVSTAKTVDPSASIIPAEPTVTPVVTPEPVQAAPGTTTTTPAG